MEREPIVFPPIMLEWGDWVAWSHLLQDARTHPDGIPMPNAAGVYEAKLRGSEELLTIGRAANLRMRVKQALVRGHGPHSTGKRIRAANEPIADIIIRWAVTDRPAAVEEELHRRYREKWGTLPTYVRRT